MQNKNAPDATRHRGRLQVWKESNGYGFIRVDGMARDPFLHISEIHRANIEGSVRPGDELEFELRPDKNSRGMRAVNITRVGK